MTHRVPFCVAVALFGPAVVTVLSSVRVRFAVRRVVKPVPAAVTLLVDDPAPKITSFALLVVADPLSMAREVPVETLLTSSGAVRSSPEYSWM
jgi:hypothetical protein